MSTAVGWGVPLGEGDACVREAPTRGADQRRRVLVEEGLLLRELLAERRDLELLCRIAVLHGASTIWTFLLASMASWLFGVAGGGPQFFAANHANSAHAAGSAERSGGSDVVGEGPAESEE